MPFCAKISSLRYFLIDKKEEITGKKHIGSLFNCSLVALYDHTFTQNMNKCQNCLGFGFIRDIDLENETLEILVNEEFAKNELKDVMYCVKSTEVAFSK